MPLGIIFGFIFLICFGFLIFSLICLPHKIVEWQGRFYERYFKTYRKMTDEEIDAIFLLPTDPFLTKPLSQFIAKAPREPGRYTRLIRAYKVVGIVMSLIWGIIVIGVSCSILQGNSI